MTEKSWKELRHLAARNDLPRILVEGVAYKMLNMDDLPKALADSWTACEWPLQAASVDVWLYLFGLAITEEEFISEDEIKLNTELAETTTLYRGCTIDYQHGMSWTTDRKRAEWFATRLESAVGPGHLYSVEAHRTQVMAVFHAARGEDEYVLDPTYIEPEEITFR